MIIDCHYHLNESMLPTDSLLAKVDEAGIDKIALMATMCGPIPPLSAGTEKALRFFLTHAPFRGLVKKLLNKFTPEGDVIIPGGTIKILLDPDNRPVFEAVDRHPNKFLGWIYVNPRGSNGLLQELDRWIKHAGVVGVKAHPFWDRFAPVDLLPVAERVAALGKPILLHLGFDGHNDYGTLLKAVPGLKLVLAHAAFPYYSKTWKEIKDLPNVYVDLSSSVYVDEAITRRAVRALGADKCLFGTDGPYGSQAPSGGFDPGMIKRRIAKLFPDEQVRAKLLGGNFSKLIST